MRETGIDRSRGSARAERVASEVLESVNLRVDFHSLKSSLSHLVTTVDVTNVVMSHRVFNHSMDYDAFAQATVPVNE